jgi:hypothetical protein
MARRRILLTLALFLGLSALTASFVQAAPVPLGPARSGGFGLADLWGALQWLLGSPVPASTRRSDLPKEGPAVDPNGSKPKPPPQTTSTSGPAEGTSTSSSSSGKYGGKH